MRMVIRLEILIDQLPYLLKFLFYGLCIFRQRLQFLQGSYRWIIYLQHSQVWHESGGNLIPSDSARRFNGAHKSDTLSDSDELQILVIEPFMGNQRLQECYQLDCLILVGFCQVDLLEDENLFRTIWRFQSFSIRSCHFLTALVQFLDQLGWFCLSVAVESYQFAFLCFLKFIYSSLQQNRLSTTLLTNDNNILIVSEPSCYNFNIFLDFFSQVNSLQSCFIIVLVFANFTIFLSQT